MDGQTNVAIHVVQGERELANDCRSLARFDLKGIPPMTRRPAAHRGQVSHRCRTAFCMSLRASSAAASRPQIEVKPTYGLTDEQVESMILDSFDHAEEDFGKRQLIEARNRGRNNSRRRSSRRRKSGVAAA